MNTNKVINLIERAQNNLADVAGFTTEDDRQVARAQQRLEEALQELSGASEPDTDPTRPDWTFTQRVTARCDWLRLGITPEELNRGYVASRAMSFGGMDQAEQDFFLAEARKRGYTHYVYERCLPGKNAYNTWDREMILTPKQMGDAARRIVGAGLIPVPLLFSQNEVRNRDLDGLMTLAERYREELSPWVGFLWALFEVNESVKFKQDREGMRGDDWVTALLGRLERSWRIPVAVHMTAPERHYYTRFEDGRPEALGERAPERPILLFQFTSWPASGPVDYKNDDGSITVMDSQAAHEEDWRITLEACRTHSALQVVLPWEFCQFSRSSNKDIGEIGVMLRQIARDYGQPGASGAGW